MLSKEAVIEFQELYVKTYGNKISFEEAQLQGERLIRLLQIVYGEDIKKLSEKRRKEVKKWQS